MSAQLTEKSRLSAIATESVGGPMAALGPLVGSIAGVKSTSIRFKIDGLKRTVRAEDLVDQACEGVGVVSGSAPDQAIALDTTATR
jgi:hypothetical protein